MSSSSPAPPLSGTQAGPRVGTPAGDKAETAMEQQEFESFYGRTWGRLWQYLRRLGRDPALADDLLQEAYLRFLHHPGKGRSEAEHRAYLYRIATNLFHDRRRREGREQRLLAQLSREDRRPFPGANTAARLDTRSALDALKPRERALLWLAYAEGWEHRQIARALDLRAASVRVLLFRARKKALRELERLGRPAAIRAGEEPPPRVKPRETE